MPKGHRLAEKKRITPADLEGEAFISLSKPDILRKLVDRVFEEAGVKRRMNIETPYSSIICSLVAQDMGVCIVNPLVAQDDRHASVIARPFDPAVPCEGMLIVPQGRPANRLGGKFADVLRQVAQEECNAFWENES
jgi:DNA-binding transcriptional LysR family regulator